MIQEMLKPRIELLEEQIENLQHSGYFTDAQIENLMHPLKKELDLLKDFQAFEFLTVDQLVQLQHRLHQVIIAKREPSKLVKLKTDAIAVAKDFFAPKPEQYGMSDQEYATAKAKQSSPSNNIGLQIGVTAEQMQEASEELSKAFGYGNYNPKNALELEVIDAEILTPNHQEA